MKTLVRNLIAGSVLAVAASAAAQSGGMEDGMGNGMGMGMTGGIVIADDGSVLSPVRGDDSSSLVAIGTNGAVRWTTPFVDALPMRLSTQGDLVVVLTVSGDTMMDGDGDGGGHGGGMGGGGGMGEGGGMEDGDRSYRLVGLALSSGAERWSKQIEGYVPMSITFAPSGSPIYVVAMEGGEGDGHHGGNMESDPMGTAKLLAFGRDGALLWSTDLPGPASGSSNRNRASDSRHR